MVRIVKKPEERRSQIIDAARRLFQSKSYEKTTMQDVMEALDIAKGTIYHYFKSKEALLEAVVEEIVEETIEKMKALLSQTKGNALEKIQLLVKAGNIAEENKDILEGLHRPGNEVMHLQLLAATLTKQAPLYGQLIKQGCKEGLFKTEAPLECAEFILSALQFLTDMGIYPWSQEDIARRIQAFPKIIEQQLNAPPGSFGFLATQMK